MSDKSRGLKAFDRCPVRAVVDRPRTRTYGSMVCSKYPSGFEVEADEMQYDYRRMALATSLGCLSCPYNKTKLQTGESAIEAITRIGSQNSIDELNLLLQEHTIEEPRRTHEK